MTCSREATRKARSKGFLRASNKRLQEKPSRFLIVRLPYGQKKRDQLIDETLELRRLKLALRYQRGDLMKTPVPEGLGRVTRSGCRRALADMVYLLWFDCKRRSWARSSTAATCAEAERADSLSGIAYDRGGRDAALLII